MYLKEISCSGFKSFADKLTISLDGKTTCIVGPNGSGKSNVVDAVRWVLGEQSVKSLRGNDTMTDVIFSGSKSRNALNVASVSLVLDNSDHTIALPYQEISIRRRVYRSGENEYYLNGEKCRLKDITDLLIDNSLGKESFNIISQGEIQKLISTSSLERRSIFESAAGVLKYKKRKEEAIRKLDKTTNNLERVLDIIHELEIQMDPLKDQAEKAKQYLTWKEKLENVEIAVLAEDIYQMNTQKEEITKKIEKCKQELLDLNVKSDSSDSMILESKNELSKLHDYIKERNQELLQLTKEEERLNGEKKMLQERSKYQANDMKVHENISRLKEEQLQNDTAISLFQKDLEELQKELSELLKKNSEIDLKKMGLQERKNALSLEQAANNKEYLMLKQKMEVLESHIESQGFLNSSVKSILHHPGLKGICDTFGNILDTNEKYVKALEVAILSVKQFVIVEDELSAKMAIEYLKENDLGRATFFPLTVMKPKAIDPTVLEEIKKEKGFIDVFSNLVTYQSKYYNIVMNQLGNVIVVETLDDANKISKKIYQRYKIVTLSGEVINIGGSVSGGSLKNSKSVLTEKKELEECKHHQEALQSVIQEQEQEKKDLDSQINTLEEEKISIQRQRVSLEELSKNKDSLIKEMSSRIEEIKRELATLGSIVDSSFSKEEEKMVSLYYDTVKKKELLEKEIEKENKNVDILEQKIEEMEAKDKLNHSTLYQCEKELRDLEMSTSKIDIKLDQALTTLSSEYEITYEKAKENYPLEMNLTDAKKEVVEYKAMLKEIGMVNIESIRMYDEIHNRYQFLNSQRNDLLNAKDTLYEIIHEMDEVMKKEFQSTFQAVRHEFQIVFKELFHGGHADLKLTDPSNLLETGIDIVASPPGKTLKAISLLSGGEMTLTAISLIFAILNVKKVPFCIFDEIEAALDEANVDNFGRYLDHYKDKTQFLIITHKKKTMEYASVLYGITMQESGVSKLVNVKLDTLEE